MIHSDQHKGATMLNVTEKAQQKVEQFFTENEDTIRAVRVYVREGG